ncbi:hypothetical protein KY285_004871 [Solanum tuberosum]|nr:hypothetical protein KY285_004871 [Solanum tuberosum]
MMNQFHDQSSREGGQVQHVGIISHETPPPQEPISLSLSAFGVHSNHFLREVVDDAKLMKEIAGVKYWKVVVVGQEYNDCEHFDDLGLFAMD